METFFKILLFIRLSSIRQLILLTQINIHSYNEMTEIEIHMKASVDKMKVVDENINEFRF